MKSLSPEHVKHSIVASNIQDTNNKWHGGVVHTIEYPYTSNDFSFLW